MSKKKEKVLISMSAICLLSGIILFSRGNIDRVYARSNDNTILGGIYIDNVELAGMTKEEANQTINSMVEDMKTKVVTFGAVNDGYVAITAGDLGVRWTNPEVIDEAAGLGKEGNIVQRYKAIEDLKHGNIIYDLNIEFDRDLIRQVLEEQCVEYDIQPVNASLKRNGGEFSVISGKTGIATDVETSLDKIYDYLVNDWDYNDTCIDLETVITYPTGNENDLYLVKDVLGTYTTNFKTSSSARCKNIETGCKHINGRTLFPGEEFSALRAITPFSEENGYELAGSYLNGKVVESLGGGICQVSTTLYNAVLLSELDVTARSNHSMIISYVKPSMDAAIAESSGKDFRFINNTDYPIYIEGSVYNKNITFSIYGVETRDPGHKVRYESEVLETTQPDKDNIVTDAGLAIGTVNVEAAHIGYKARLWRIVEENGVEVSREVINKSTYKVSPRTVTVGLRSSNPDHIARMKNAVSTRNVDMIKAEAANIKNEMLNP